MSFSSNLGFGFLLLALRITGRNLNHIKVALAHHSTIIDNILMDDGQIVKPSYENLYGENIKIIRQHKLKLKLLTLEEKDEIVVKYESGMTMTDIAKQYGCHYTTVGRLLRMGEVEIREK